MPDKAKFQSLRKADFKILPTCGRCSHFFSGDREWGTCKITTYIHGKHAGDKRCASVPRDGYCPRFLRDEERVAKLGSHIEFFPE